VRVVNGDPRNLKVTTPDDLEMVRALIRSSP
jgi:2-C-methyl-D-erythritol 4-phosphate cytidylyltransferase